MPYDHDRRTWSDVQGDTPARAYELACHTLESDKADGVVIHANPCRRQSCTILGESVEPGMTICRHRRRQEDIHILCLFCQFLKEQVDGMSRLSCHCQDERRTRESAEINLIIYRIHKRLSSRMSCCTLHGHLV